MITFDDARAAAREAWPDYRFASYGYETDSIWILLTLPETIGGRVGAVTKSTGMMRWIQPYSAEYSQERPVGRWPDAARA